MRKFIFTLLACFVAAPVALAQVSIIPKIGLNIGKLNVDQKNIDMLVLSGNDGEVKNTSGFVGGVGFNFAINEYFSVQPELLYSQRGFKAAGNQSSGSTGNGSGVTGEFTQKISYLDIPVLAKYTYSADKLKLFVNLGPYFSYALSGKYKAKYSGTDPDTGFPLNFNIDGSIKFDDVPAGYYDNIDPASVLLGAQKVDVYYADSVATRWDAGLVFGGGIGYEAGPGTLLLDIRYGLGLTNFFKKQEGDDTDNTSKNRLFQFTLGYAIPLGKK